MNLSGANILFPPGCLDLSRPGEQLETHESSINLDVVGNRAERSPTPGPQTRTAPWLMMYWAAHEE